jgi:hypothetical protein
MKKRHVFSGSADFCLYDFYGPDGGINENVFAYSNRAGDERALIFYNNSYYQAMGWIYRGAVAIPQKDGNYRLDTLCEALGLHGEGRFFTVFREQRSGLWYIRSSKEIAERGLYAALNGYEAQVFLDIQEKEDAPNAQSGTWEGRWALLNYELNGRGVRNIDEAVMDTCLRELYTPFREILSSRRFEELGRFFSPRENADALDSSTPHVFTDFIESFKEPVNTFVEAAKKYLGGNNGKYIPFGGENTYDETLTGKMEWVQGLENILALSEMTPLKKSASGKTKKAASAVTKAITGEEYLRSLADNIREKPALASLALGYNTLALLRSIAPNTPDTAASESAGHAEALVRHWQLDRVARECWENTGINHEEARRAAEIALALLARTGPAVSESGLKPDHKSDSRQVPKTPGAIAAAIILENYETPDFVKILGVNRFDDVTWFNKEAFEETLFLAPFFLSLDTPCAFGKETESDKERLNRVKTIAAVTEAFRLAEEASGYRFDELSRALSEAGGEASSRNGQDE